MSGHSRATLPVITLAALVAVGGVVATQVPPLTADEGRRLEEKLSQISDYEALGESTPHTVVLREREINAYLRFQGAPSLPDGVRDPHLTLGNGGRIESRAIVDLDAVSQNQPRGVFDPLAYLSGALEVVASGTLDAADGLGRVMVEAVSVGGIPVPRVVLDELVRHYTRNELHPEGIDLDAPFALPYDIDEISIDVGQATVVQ